MPDIFYQANFCAECGNPLEPCRTWRPRYFCDECSARIARRGLISPYSLLIGLLAVWLILNDKQTSTSVSKSLGQSQAIVAPAAVSAFDASPKQNPQNQGAKAETHETVERTICGARTKKGTPCRHIVRPGQRCVQHRGMASMLDKKSTR